MSEIIAIDPGTAQSAILIWNGLDVAAPRIIENDKLLFLLRNDDSRRPLAVEMIACFGMPVGAETFETCRFIGRIQEIWEAKDLPIRFVYRREVKMHLCGTMRAKDPNIRRVLMDRFGVVGTKKNPGPLFGVKSHMWAALAVAVTAMDTGRSGSDLS